MWTVETRKLEGTEWILFWVIGPVSKADLRDWHNAPAEPLLTLDQNVNQIQKSLLFPATSFISSAQFEAYGNCHCEYCGKNWSKEDSGP